MFLFLAAILVFVSYDGHGLLFLPSLQCCKVIFLWFFFVYDFRLQRAGLQTEKAVRGGPRRTFCRPGPAPFSQTEATLLWLSSSSCLFLFSFFFHCCYYFWNMTRCTSRRRLCINRVSCALKSKMIRDKELVWNCFKILNSVLFTFCRPFKTRHAGRQEYSITAKRI